MGINQNTFCLHIKALRSWSLCFLLLTSCNYFETKKIDSQTFYNQDYDAISWDQVDKFPLFLACDEQASKEQQQLCFVTELSKVFQAYFEQERSQSAMAIQDTAHINMQVLHDGTMQIVSIKVSPETLKVFPLLESWLSQSLALADNPQPAIKRGIPVAVRFELPVVLATTD